ncbi:MAG: hypothetical protein Q9171_002010 [Xanthocarpia ochracea]
MIGPQETLPGQSQRLTADPEDALQPVVLDYDEEDHKTCPDYDSEQDATQGIQQRLMVRAGRSKGSTILLRNIKIDGKGYRAGFVDSTDRRSILIKGMKPGLRTKVSKTGLFESKSLPPRLKGKDGNQIPPLKQAHVDHIADLGILTELAKRDSPEGITEAAWKLFRDAVLGEKDQAFPVSS